MLAELDGAEPPTVCAVTDTPLAVTVALFGPLAVTLVMLRLAVAEPPLTWFSSLSVSSIIISTTLLLHVRLGMPEGGLIPRNRRLVVIADLIQKWERRV